MATYSERYIGTGRKWNNKTWYERRIEISEKLSKQICTEFHRHHAFCPLYYYIQEDGPGFAKKHKETNK